MSSEAPTLVDRQAAAQRRRLRFAGVSAAALVLLTVAVFVKDNPFDSPYEIKAEFASAVQLRDGSAVRIAGVDVGSVTAIEPGRADTSVVSIELGDSAMPITSDAHLSIEPRLALEGNFYVKVAPGSPGAPRLESGATIPLEQTEIPVQIDQVITTFGAPVREDLQTTFDELARGFGRGRGGGPSGARSLRRAVGALDRSLESVARTANAFRGQKRGDLAAAVGSTGALAEQLARDPAQLAELMTSYASVSATLAARDVELAAAIEGFDETFGVMPATLPLVDAALDELAAISPDLRAGLEPAPETLAAASELVGQVERAVRAPELPRLLERLRPATSVLPELLRRTENLSPLLAELARCLNQPVLPTLNAVVPDGNLTTGDPAWLELMHLGGSAGGGSAGFDGNGSALRLGVTAGEQQVTGYLPNLGQLEAAIPANSSMNPEWLGFGRFPPEQPGAQCSEQAPPDLDVRGGSRPFDWMTPSDLPLPTAADTTRLGKQARGALRRMGLIEAQAAGEAGTR